MVLFFEYQIKMMEDWLLLNLLWCLFVIILELNFKHG
jgi:hypothetical protein